MNITKNIPVPTGNILVVDGCRGQLECLSIGDYGKDVNLKADFLGLSREPSPVRHTNMLPLEKKWVITVSTQYGCTCSCRFCDVPKIQPRLGNATLYDLIGQVDCAMSLHPEVKECERLNLHYARMGEPSFNDNVGFATAFLAGKFKKMGWGFHPVVSTMMPRNNPHIDQFIKKWMWIKNELMEGDAGLQISINSTDERWRDEQFNNRAMALSSIARSLEPYADCEGRKITLNFTVGPWEIDGEKLRKYFDPQLYLCKLTPMHQTQSVMDNNLMPDGDWTEYHPYQKAEESLKKSGYEVIVFIASKEEDESRITCGNAVLSLK